MHIPDGYLGPYTYLTLWVIMIPIWIYAGKRLSAELKSKQVPLLALSAAFSFVIMMFNLPVPGGSTGHAVGGAIIGIILGPWAAMVSISVTLVIQLLMFGDGGLTTLGANCFNIAFVLPFSAYYIYKLISGNSKLNSTRRLAAAAIAGYISLVLAAGVTGFELGIQPMLHRDVSGLPQYMPFDLKLSMPFMLGEHLLFFGIVEALVTVLVFTYIRNANPALLGDAQARLRTSQASSSADIKGNKSMKKMVAALLILIVLTPLGLLATGNTFGEWSKGALKEMIGYTPEGLEKLSSIWNAPMQGYAFPGMESTGSSAVGYIASAIIGVTLCIGAIYLFARRATKKGHD